jgi:hypothetical protein
MSTPHDEIYTQALSARVHAVLADLYPGLEPALVECIVCEALFNASADLRAGRPVALEYLGELRRIELADGPCIRYRAAERLLERER